MTFVFIIVNTVFFSYRKIAAPPTDITSFKMNQMQDDCFSGIDLYCSMASHVHNYVIAI